jgi:hypothetical protein
MRRAATVPSALAAAAAASPAELHVPTGRGSDAATNTTTPAAAAAAAAAAAISRGALHGDSAPSSPSVSAAAIAAAASRPRRAAMDGATPVHTTVADSVLTVESDWRVVRHEGLLNLGVVVLLASNIRWGWLMYSWSLDAHVPQVTTLTRLLPHLSPPHLPMPPVSSTSYPICLLFNFLPHLSPQLPTPPVALPCYAMPLQADHEQPFHVWLATANRPSICACRNARRRQSGRYDNFGSTASVRAVCAGGAASGEAGCCSSGARRAGASGRM